MSTYSTNLKIELIGTGEQAGTWGVTTDDNFSNVFEQSIVGRVTVPFTDADVTLTATNSVSSQSFRNVYLNCTGTNTASRNLIVPTINKNYVVQNNTTGGFNIVVKTTAGTGITIPNGKTCTVYADGTNVIQAFDYLPVATVGTLTITSITAGSITDSGLTSGRVTYAGTAGLLQDSANLTFNGTTLTSTGFAGPISGVVTSTSITDSGLTSGRVTYATTGGLLTDAGTFTYDGTVLTVSKAAATPYISISNGTGGINIGVDSADNNFAFLNSLNSIKFLVNTGTAEAMRINSTTAIGVGYVPTSNAGAHSFGVASYSGIIAGVTLGGSGNDYGTVGYNAGFTVTNDSYKYLATDYSSIIQFSSGGFKFLTAPSGTAGNAVTFTERMRIDNAGNVGIGTSSPYAPANYGNLTVNGTNGGTFSLFTNGTRSFTAYSTTGAVVMGSVTSVPLVLTTNDTERMRIDSSGNVGIGTSNPTSLLNLYKAGSTEVACKYQNGNATAGFVVGVSTAGVGLVYHIDSQPIIFATANTERMRIDSSGNVGINVVPKTWFSVYKLISIGSGTVQNTFAGQTNDYVASIWTNSYADAVNTERYIDASYASKYTQGGVGGSPYIWKYAAAGTAGAAITWNEAMRIDSAGNVGIGGGATQRLNVFNVAGGPTKVYIQSDLNFAGAYIGTSTANRGGNVELIGHTDGSNSDSFKIEHANDSAPQALTFSYAAPQTAYSSLSYSEKMRIDSNGNVGIGLTNPATYGKLAVAGSIVATGSGGAIVLNRRDTNVYASAIYSASGGMLWDLPGVGTAMTLDASAYLFVNTTTSSYSGAVARTNINGGTTSALVTTTSGGAAYAAQYVHNTATTGNNEFITFGTEATWTARGAINYNRAAGLTVYNTTSDYRAKDIISPVLNSGEVIDSVPVYMGKMKDATQERPMFIAHETPDYAHTGEKDAVDKDGNPVYQQMDASSLVPVLWAEVQSLRKRLALLESK